MALHLKRRENKCVSKTQTNNTGGAVKAVCMTVTPLFQWMAHILLIMDSRGGEGLLLRDLHFYKPLVELMLSSN